MDAERFGRALGIGVRETAKALLKAADAAAAPNPRPSVPGSRPVAPNPRPAPSSPAATRPTPPAPRPVKPAIAARTVITPSHAITSPRSVQQGGKRFGRAIWAPAARAGGVLWHEVTGFFFGLFALTAGVELYKRRLAFAATGSPREKAWFAVALLLMFSWFTASSFLKAHRRARRP